MWLLIVVAMIVVAGASGGKTNDEFTIPGTESQHVTDLLKVKLPALSGAQTTVVFAVPNGTKVTDSGPKAGIEQAVANLGKVPGVVQSADPFQGGPISQNGQVALGNLQWSQQPAGHQGLRAGQREVRRGPGSGGRGPGRVQRQRLSRVARRALGAARAGRPDHRVHHPADHLRLAGRGRAADHDGRASAC